MPSFPPSARARVPSLAPPSSQNLRRRYASGEYVVDRARAAAPMATVRSLFDTQAPPAALELEMRGPISGPKDAAPPSSREMDRADFDFSDAEAVALELEQERSAIRAVPPPPSLSSEESKAALRATNTRAVIDAFAAFGARPTTIFQTPGYALRVFLRRRELAKELAYARRGRSPDVALFEDAMSAYDASAAAAGTTILGALAFAVVALSLAALVWI